MSNQRGPGQIGPFQVLGKLGQGGMGVVYVVRDPRLDRKLALKLILQSRENPVGRERFWREAKALAEIRHPGVVRMHKFGSARNGTYIAMELVEGRPLSDLLREGERLPFERTTCLMRDLADAVAAVHAHGILHRDIKPANIMIRDLDGSPVLLDFGLVRDESAEQLTRTGTTLGTISYMSPEQARGSSSTLLTPACDVYSLGVILFELLCGVPLYGGQSAPELIAELLFGHIRGPREVDPGVPVDLDAICRRALSRDPAERYPTAGELRDDLDRVLRGEYTSTTRRSRIAAGVALTGLLILVVCLAVHLTREPQAAEPAEVSERQASEPDPVPKPTPASWIWQERDVVGRPSIVVGTSGMTYDSKRQVVLVLGLSSGSPWPALWSWDGEVWNKLSDSGEGPRIKHGQAMAYDTHRDLLVVHGGLDSWERGTSPIKTMWEWNGRRWRERTVKGRSPGPRAFHAMVYDSDRKVMVLYGGSTATRVGGLQALPTGDLWEWNGATWHLAEGTFAKGPPVRGHFSLVYDSRRKVIVLFGGNAEDDHLWEWSPKTRWRRPNTARTPGRLRLPGLVFDGQRVLLFGGDDLQARPAKPLAHTWTWDGLEWRKEQPSTSPPPRSYFGMAWDARRRVAVVAGGWTPEQKWRDVWEYGLTR